LGAGEFESSFIPFNGGPTLVFFPFFPSAAVSGRRLGELIGSGDLPSCPNPCFCGKLPRNVVPGAEGGAWWYVAGLDRCSDGGGRCGGY